MIEVSYTKTIFIIDDVGKTTKILKNYLITFIEKYEGGTQK